jgi:serine/threonine protein kinase
MGVQSLAEDTNAFSIVQCDKTEKHISHPNVSIVKKLGEGEYGRVDLVKDEENNLFALKTLSSQLQANREIEAGHRLNHPSICKILANWTEDGKSVMLMQFIQGSDIFSVMKAANFEPFTEKKAKTIFYQLASALDHCHSKGVAHRDVKLDNVMLDADNRVTLIDFGFSRAEAELENLNRCTEILGSLRYECPEIIKGTPYDARKADVWSAGVVLHSILFGRYPFTKEDISEYRKSDCPLKLKFEEGTFVSKEARDLLQKMLHTDESKRPSMYKILKHPWFRSAALACSPRLLRHAKTCVF